MSGRSVGFAVTFFIPVVLVRLLDQTDFGTYKQIFLIAGTLYVVGQLGMAESLFYFLPLSPRQGARFVANSLLALVLGGFGSLAVLELGGGAVSRWLSNGALSRYAPAVGVYLVFMQVSAVLEIVMISRKRYAWASYAYVALDVLRMALLVVPVLVIHRLEWLLMGAVVFAVIRCATALWYVWREFDGALRPDAALLRRQLAYAVPFQLSAIVEILQGNLHNYAVSHYFDAATFAIYSVGCLQIPLVDFVLNSVSNVMMVRMAEEIRDGRGRAAAAVWRDTTRRLALVLGLIGWLLAAFHLVGAIVVTVFASAVMKWLGVLRARSLMGVSLAEVLPWRNLGAILGVAAGAAGAAAWVKTLMEAPPLVELIVVGAVYAATYAAGLYAFGLLRQEERLIVRNWLARWGIARRGAHAGEAGGR